MLKLADKWIWDFWLARNGDDWHIYFLQADKRLGDPNLRHRHVTQGHAVSTDLRNWRYLGTCFAPSSAPGWDDWTTWTGSVVPGPNGVWHLFYTGTSHAGGGLQQRIGHATSSNMHDWRRVGDGLCLDISGPDYEEHAPGRWHDRAFRDPWVMPDPAGGGWLMYMVSRVPGEAEPNAAGSIGFATSPDLYAWTLRPPVYRGGMFGQMEVPEVVELGSRWYCLFCTDAAHWSDAYRRLNPQPPVRGTHYLVADDPRGPWRIAPGPFLDGDRVGSRYAGKLVRTDEGLLYLAFLHDRPDGSFAGEISDPIPVRLDADGWLHLDETAG